MVFVCLSLPICVCWTRVSCVKMAELIRMLFGWLTTWVQATMCYVGGQDRGDMAV